MCHKEREAALRLQVLSSVAKLADQCPNPPAGPRVSNRFACSERHLARRRCITILYVSHKKALCDAGERERNVIYWEITNDKAVDSLGKASSSTDDTVDKTARLLARGSGKFRTRRLARGSRISPEICDTIESPRFARDSLPGASK